MLPQYYCAVGKNNICLFKCSSTCVYAELFVRLFTISSVICLCLCLGPGLSYYLNLNLIWVSNQIKMPTEQSVFSDLLSIRKSSPLDLKNPFQMTLQFNSNSAIFEHERERSASRSPESTHSSIIDPGEEKTDINSLEDSFENLPNKRLCTEYGKFNFTCADKKADCKKMLHSTNNNCNDSLSLEKCKPVRSFLIKDILSPKDSDKDFDSVDCKNESRGFIRPWDTDTVPSTYISQLNMAMFQSLHYSAITSLHPSLNLFQNPYQAALSNYRVMPNRRPRSADDDSRSERSESDSPESPASNSANNSGSSPLDALFEMTSKAFDRTEASDKTSGGCKKNNILINHCLYLWY